MRSFWIAILVLGCAAIAAFLLVPQGDTQGVLEPAAPSPVSVVPATATNAVLPKAPDNRKSSPASAQAPPAQPGETLSIGMDAKIEGATVKPGRLVRKEGAIVADGKYTIRGNGTKESPYDISWDLLMSASDTFIPRLGEKQIPQRVAMLHNAYIRVNGYIAFPLVATETSECLVMLNQWDGCCIGVPPSPYDAIEVKLVIPTDNSVRHQVRVGTLEGVFHVDPYVVERWLVGLYTMDGATLSTEM